MSYEDVINIINAHYGWSMDAHEPEYKGEIKEKMQAMKQLVKELNVKAEAFDECEAKAKAYDRAREKVYARINHIIRTSHPDQRKPGYIDGLYNALDIISEELESGESDE